MAGDPEEIWRRLSDARHETSPLPVSLYLLPKNVGYLVEVPGSKVMRIDTDVHG